MTSKIMLCLVSSSGGHLFQTHRLQKWWKKHERFWVTKDDPYTRSLLKREKVLYGFFPENRNFFNFFRNLILAFTILSRHKPTLVFSTGAGIAPPFFIVAKLLGIKTIFMETFIFIPQPTLSGRFIYLIADTFIVQNKGMLKTYPRAVYLGSVL